MKAKLTGLALLGLAAVFLSSCDLAIPSKLQVKASPTVNAAFGSTDFAISEYFSVSDVTDAFTGGDASSPMKVYDYIDSTEPNVQKFLMHMNVMEMPINMSEYMDEMDFGSDLDTKISSIDFAVPAVGFSTGASVSLDINSIVQGNLDAGAPIPVTIAETGSGSTIAATIPTQTISISGFETATLSAGSLNIEFQVGSPTPGYALNITGVQLTDPNNGDAVIASSTGTADAVGATQSARTLTIPLAGRTLPSEMEVVISATTSGGIFPTSRTLTVTPGFSNDSQVSGATGFAVNETLPIAPAPISLSGASGFVSAVLGAGSKIDLVIEALPSSYVGMHRTLDLTISQGATVLFGDTNIDLDTLPLNTLTIDLSGATIVAADPIEVNGTVYVNGATNETEVTGLDGSSLSLDWSVASTIPLLSSVTVNGLADFPVQTVSVPIEAGTPLHDWVEEILFDKVGLEFTFVNGLPAGNDLELTGNSNAFGITNATTTLTAATGTPVSMLNDSGDTMAFLTNDYSFVPADHVATGIDFSISVLPENYDSGTGDFTLVNIAPGTTYSFSVTPGTMEVVSDWSQAIVDASSQSFEDVFPADGQDPIDLSSITDYLGNGLTFEDIEAYVYISGIQNAATQAEFGLSGIITATYKTEGPTDSDLDDVSHPVNLVGTPGTPAALDFSALPVFPEGTVYNDDPDPLVEGEPLPTGSGVIDVSAQITTILNDKPKNMTFSYAVSAGTATIYPSTLTDDMKVSVDLVLILPLTLGVASGGADIDLDQFLASESEPQADLFGRDPGETDETIEKALDSLASMSMNLVMTNRSGIGGVFHLIGANGFDASFELSSDASGPQNVSIGLTHENILAMKTAPFTFDTLRIEPEGGATKISVNRDDPDPANKTIVISQVTARIETAVDQVIEF